MGRLLSLRASLRMVIISGSLLGVGLEIQSEERNLSAPIVRVSHGNKNPFSKSVEPNGESKQRPMLKIPLSKSSDLKVVVKVSRECFLGDMEVIYLETGWSGEKTVTVSLESFDPQVPFLASKQVAVKDLSGSNLELDFTLPLVSKPLPLGLFICKDSAKTGSCLNKAVEKSEDIFARYDPRKPAVDFEAKGFRDISDKSYFFGHLVGYKDGVEVTDGALTESAVAQLYGALSRAADDQGAKFVERIKKLHETLGSLPLSPRDSAVQITLPSVTDEGCG
jgi:hypothetical protein